MNTICKLLFSPVITAFLFFAFSPGSLAATVNGTLNVTAEIGVGCQVNASSVVNGSAEYGTLNFGSIYSLGAQHVDAETTGTNQGAITVECSSGTGYNITISGGQNYQAATRAMATATPGSDLLNYTLYQDPQRQTEWTANTAIPFTAPAVAEATVHNIYGRIPGGQSGVAAGSYTDQVAVVVNW